MAGRAMLVVVLISTVALGLSVTSKMAYAHTVVDHESASYLAKVQEIPVETHSIAVDVGNLTLVQWHVAKLQRYWSANDTSQLAARNQSLANQITASIANLTGEATKPQPNMALVNQLVKNIDGYLLQSIAAEIDQSKLQNDTVGALAIANVLDEAIADYGNATSSNVSGNMNMSTPGHLPTPSTNMSSMQASNATFAQITNFAAYQSAEALAKVANSMWSALRAHTQGGSLDLLSNLDEGFAQIAQDIDGKRTVDLLTITMQKTVAPNLATLYNLQIPGYPSAISSPSILEMKRIDYLNETSLQRHNEHLKQNEGTIAPYNASLNYVLNASGFVILSGASNSSGSQTAQVMAFLSVFKSSPAVVSMDVMNGSVTTASGEIRTIQSGFAYYLPFMHKLVIFGYIPIMQGNAVTSVQLAELWCTVDSNAKLPSNNSDSPMIIKMSSPESKVGSDWELQGSGQVTLS